MTREAAIKIIRKEYLCVDRDCDIERSCGKCDLMMPTKDPILEAYKMAIEALKQEPKTGHWEYVQYDGNPNIGNWHCSECDRIVSGAMATANQLLNAYRYCPNCGTDMRGEE